MLLTKAQLELLPHNILFVTRQDARPTTLLEPKNTVTFGMGVVGVGVGVGVGGMKEGVDRPVGGGAWIG